MTSPALKTLVGSRSLTTSNAVVVDVSRTVIDFESAPWAGIVDNPRLAPTIKTHELSFALLTALSP